MTNLQQGWASVFDISLRKRILTLVLLAVFATALLASAPAYAQTFQVLHNFTWGADGRGPADGVVLDRAGNLYGVARYGEGNFGGQAFKMTRRGSSWIFTPIHTFVVSEGTNPQGLTIGPDGNLYGTATAGGANCGFPGCGTVFKLSPPARFCASLDCSWPLTVLYNFQGGSDGYSPVGGVIFDQAGNLYGAAFSGGLGGQDGYCCGVTYEMSPGNGSWTYNVTHTFGLPNDGDHPQGPLAFDSAGNLYGTTIQGGTTDQGGVFQMTPSASGWNETVLWSFLGSPDGNTPNGGVFVDPAGKVYGTTYHGGTGSNCGIPYCGAVFQVSPANGGWDRILTLLLRLVVRRRPAGVGSCNGCSGKFLRYDLRV